MNAQVAKYSLGLMVDAVAYPLLSADEIFGTDNAPVQGACDLSKFFSRFRPASPRCVRRSDRPAVPT
jgi:hypothetical protein